MEEIKAYIESGILELYVLGDVTPNEKRQVEEMASKYPEIKTELDGIERSMELYAKENEVEPSKNLRSRVLGSLLTNLGDDRNFTAAPRHTDVEDDTDIADEEDDNIIPLPARKENDFYKYAFAASLALLIASTIALVSVYSKLQDSNNQLVALQLDKQHFANRVNLMDKELSVFRDTSYKLIHLKGTAKTPSSVVTVAFSPGQKKVVIDMANMKMPENDKEHQYQLWALVGGKPVDLGVFDAKRDTITDIKEMKSIASADAFAVTLEPRGGSVNPTMDQMMVLGKY
ncbi:anti-sigma factor [Mucilaginibacter sp.]|uniref:anti-sigma factor n=1 Tax=Mucilaginibacter sp. TaxID=1882438 RepID=UPI0025E03DD3|nr:anti-sigma factor [Mucilaginibacter sp.]